MLIAYRLRIDRLYDPVAVLHGYGKVSKCRVPLNDNQIISDNLGEFGVHGMEELTSPASGSGIDSKNSYSRCQSQLW